MAVLGPITVILLGAYVAIVFFVFRDQLSGAVDTRLRTYGDSVAVSVRDSQRLPPPPAGAGQLGAIVIDDEGTVVASRRSFELFERGLKEPEKSKREGNKGRGNEEDEHRDDAEEEDESEDEEDRDEDDRVDLSRITRAASAEGTFLDLTIQGLRFRVHARSLPTVQGEWTIATLTPATARDVPVTRLLVVSLIGLGATLFVFGVLLWWAGGIAVKPLERLATSVRSIDETDPRHLDYPNDPAEVAEVGGAVDSLLKRITTSIDRERVFIADASHELRNPLGSLRAELELAVHKDDPAQLRESISGAISDVERLGRLTEDLLLLARMETGARWKMAPVHLEDVVGEVIIAHGPEAEDRGVRLKLSGEAGQVWGLEPLISRAVGNIIENAIRHAPVGSTVDVRLWPGTGFNGVDVIDRGSGIPPSEMEQIFERFARVERGRERSTGGSGLGLAIVRSITDYLGGSVQCLSGEPGRTVFSISFPSHDGRGGETNQ